MSYQRTQIETKQNQANSIHEQIEKFNKDIESIKKSNSGAEEYNN